MNSRWRGQGHSSLSKSARYGSLQKIRYSGSVAPQAAAGTPFQACPSSCFAPSHIPSDGLSPRSPPHRARARGLFFRKIHLYGFSKKSTHGRTALIPSRTAQRRARAHHCTAHHCTAHHRTAHHCAGHDCTGRPRRQGHAAGATAKFPKYQDDQPTLEGRRQEAARPAYTKARGEGLRRGGRQARHRGKGQNEIL